ncbi:peroxisome protein [Spatholobus suberectus]|nr:peroxisome protein [Spatholobus suberectus]
MRSLFRSRLSHLSPSPARTLLVRLQACELSSSPHRSRDVRVSVWWDLKNCNVPAGVDPSKVAPAITQAVRANGIKGPLHITAFGDVQLLSKSNQEALASTGVQFIHLPIGGKNSVNILVDIMFWVFQNPPPAHLFLISGDRDFACILHRLRMNNYNILLASPEKASDVLFSAATIMWQWSSLLKGENLIGKHFNHPPDGPFGSWYGNSKVPLENPFPAAEQSKSLQNVEIYEPSLDLKIGAVPKSIVRQVKHILSSHPKGMSITDVRAELTKCEVHLDKSLYGFRSFSRFLLSIPHVQLQPLGNGNFGVCLVPSKPPKPFDGGVVLSTSSAVKNEERGHADETPSIATFHARSMNDDSKSFQPVPPQGKTIGEYVDGKSSFRSLVERHEFQPQNQLQKSFLVSEKVVDVANAQVPEIQQPSKDKKYSETKTSSLKTRSKKSSDNDNVKSEDASHKIVGKHTTSGNHCTGNDHTTMENNGAANCELGNFKAKNKYESPTRKEADEVCCSSTVDDSLVDKRLSGIAETYNKRPTFFSWIRSWWPFWKSNAKSDDSAAHQNKVVSNLEDSKLLELDQTVSHFEEPKLSELDQNVIRSGKPELFSSGSFWSDLESFISKPKGSLLVSQSKNREDMAHKLQNDGPLVLRSLTQKDIVQLVELLIAEKKWLVEIPSQTFPFMLIQPVQKNSLMGQSHGPNGMRSVFLSRASQSKLQKSFEHDVEKHNQSIPHTRVSATATEMKYTERSRNDILEDLQKLVNEILWDHPEGYNISSFRRLFVDRYGYHLDIQKLGHQKLASLLQIMPGVKLESTYIFPSVSAVSASDGETSILKTQITSASHAVLNSDSEISDSAPKDNNMESPWEELGPVSVKNSNQSDLASKLSQEVEIYEPSLDLKLGTVPKSVIRQIRQILRSHPKGISITDLRAELTKCNVCLDKSFYGYNTFSHFLSSIPHVKLQPLGDGKFCVSLVTSESPETFESNAVHSITSAVKIDESNAKSDDLAAHQNKVVSHLEDSKLSELDQTVSHFEEPKLSELDQNVICSGKPEVFSCGSFWNDMESFIFMPKGSLLVSQSKNREDMAHKLQKDGPPVLRSVTEKDILQLVDLLISEKKWLEESLSQTFPFRLSQPVQKNSLMGQSHGANGLSSLFLSRASLTNLQKPFEHDVEKHNQSIPHTRVSATAIETKHTERSRNDILEDCQKLVSEILREHPEGYSISSFPSLFVDRYDYHLDLQKLGYQKLATLIQIMPEVKVESTYIFPSVPAVSASDGETFNLKTQVTNASHAHAVSNSDSELSDSASEDDNMESPWGELVHDYEPIVSDYDSSESEGDCSYLTRSEKQGNPRWNEQDSSFWQALDLLHSSKERENSAKKSDNVGRLGNTLADILNSSPESTRGTLSKIPVGNYSQSSQKNYSFVADPGLLPDKDRLVDGILNGLKKADESKMKN